MAANAAETEDPAPPGEEAPRAAPSVRLAPSADTLRARSRRRIQLAQELVLEIQTLRRSLHDSLEQYELRMSAQIAEVLRGLQGADEDAPPRAPAVKTSTAMLRAIRGTEVKPRKGRAKDLVRLQELVAQLTEMLPPRN